MLTEEQKRMRDTVIHNFFSKDGRLKTMPAQLKKKLIILEHLVSQLDASRKYEEKEINEFIKQFHEDYATIRREWIIHLFMSRDNQVYEVNPKEMWDDWAQLK